jgi:guanylate kinase
MNTGKRFVILSGPSCVGKGPLQCAVRKLHPGLLDARPILCTDRAPRETEVHGRDYYFLPTVFIQSLGKSEDFAVARVRSDWQAIHLQQVRELLERSNGLVFAEVYHVFGAALLKEAASLGFQTTSVFLLPRPLGTSRDDIICTMEEKLRARGTDDDDKILDRARSAPDEMASAWAYTHRLLNPAGEDDVDEWGECGTRHGKKGEKTIGTLADLGLKARWLVETFMIILRGDPPSGDYAQRPR